MITRRKVLRIAAGIGAASTVPALAGCGDRATGAEGPEGLFSHGVASGDPLPDAAILWTRVSVDDGAPVDVEWQISADERFRDVVSEGTAVARAERDHTVKVDAAGLEAGTIYYYRFRALGRTSPTGRTRTAPRGRIDALRFAVVSCSSFAHGYFHAYRELAGRDDLDAVFHLGDYIYEYGSGQFGAVRAYEPAHEAVTLTDYRQRYAQYRRDPDLQAIHQRHPFITVWDDHESANDSWRDGAQNHDPATEGEWAARRAAAQQAYFEWLPIREQEGGRIYRAFSFGDLVDLLMLDTRLWGRDEQTYVANDPQIRDPQRQLLGADQEAWLRDRLRDSRATWRLLGQQVVMGPIKVAAGTESQGGGQILNPDQWDGYFAARRRLFDAVRSENPDNLVVLTGDIHTSWAIELTDDPNDPAVYDPSTGAGAVGVEFVTTSVTSPGIAGITNEIIPIFQPANPHIRWADVERRGYVILDVAHERTQATWFHFERVDLPEPIDSAFARSFQVLAGQTMLREVAQG